MFGKASTFEPAKGVVMILEAICNSTLLQSKKEGAQGARVPHAVYSSLGKSVHVPAHAVYSAPQAFCSSRSTAANGNTAREENGNLRATQPQALRAAKSQALQAAKPQAQQVARPTSAYAATFKRIEKKYCLTAEQYEKLLPHIQSNMQPDEYPQTVVSSLYFDTPENELISRSLEKPLYKEKLRVRSYGTLQPNGSVLPVSDQVFVELKKKYKGVVYKRRLALPKEEARMFLCGKAKAGVSVLPKGASFQERQVAREISAFLRRYSRVAPTMITQCVRTAYKQPAGGALRITFDAQLRAGHPAGDPFLFCMDDSKMNLMRKGQILMEIKCAGGMPLWLVNALSQNQIYPQSFSKYGTAYEKERKNA